MDGAEILLLGASDYALEPPAPGIHPDYRIESVARGAPRLSDVSTGYPCELDREAELKETVGGGKPEAYEKKIALLTARRM